MHKWIHQQLTYLNELEAQPEFFPNQHGDVRAMIREAGRRAALAGLPAAVEACDIRAGGLSPSAARQILAACLAAMPLKRTARLTPPEVAKHYGVPARAFGGLLRSSQCIPCGLPR
ncbi:hypothetical protein ETAA8_13520 [Anatilimnocola aggregata]|uniref:Uncharacterized protein n=1 Tax=Anatilimnocola aggregata TaxID=2528021 RepID=A0A517Y7U4_9BACT|nr:hypothetical protein [Anatilimnocola aggregata]QDU26275.1 hypothetical protein ETAA8_13520 [Anatilimnocola aggregata]